MVLTLECNATCTFGHLSKATVILFYPMLLKKYIYKQSCISVMPSLKSASRYGVGIIFVIRDIKLGLWEKKEHLQISQEACKLSI